MRALLGLSCYQYMFLPWGPARLLTFCAYCLVAAKKLVCVDRKLIAERTEEVLGVCRRR